jgi:hypothetical protein
VFENRMLKRIFLPKSNEIIGGWKTLHNEERVAVLLAMYY